MLCCIITTQQKYINQTYASCAAWSRHNQNSINNPYPFNPVWRRSCFAAWSKNQISTNRTYGILTHFIHHGIVDALLHDLHKTRPQSIKHTSSLPISSIMASQMLCWMISTKSVINQSNPHNPFPFHPSWRRRMLCCMISTKSEINQSNIRNPYPFHSSRGSRCAAAWSSHKKSINPT